MRSYCERLQITERFLCMCRHETEELLTEDTGVQRTRGVLFEGIAMLRGLFFLSTNRRDIVVWCLSSKKKSRLTTGVARRLCCHENVSGKLERQINFPVCAEADPNVKKPPFRAAFLRCVCV